MQRYYPMSNFVLFHNNLRPSFVWTGNQQVKPEDLEDDLPENHDVNTENQDVNTENQDVNTEDQDVNTENQDVNTENQDVNTEDQKVRARPTLTMRPGATGMVSIKLALFDPESPDAALHPQTRPIPTVYYLLRDRKARPNQHVVRSFHAEFGGSFTGFPRALGSKYLLLSPVYNADDSVVVEVFVEHPFMVHRVHSYDGTLKWRIDSWPRRMTAEFKGGVEFHESPYFYTAEKGYRVQARVSSAGGDRAGRPEDRGEGLVVRVVFLSGKFDADLPRSFPHRTTVSVDGFVSQTVVRDLEEASGYDVHLRPSSEEERPSPDDGTVTVRVQIVALLQMNNFSLLSERGGPPEFTWIITEIRELLQLRGSFTVESEVPFTWSAYPSVGAVLKLTLVDTEPRTLTVGLNLFPQEPRAPQIELVPAVFYVLRDRTGNQQHLVRSAHAHSGLNFNYNMEFCSLFRKSWLASPVYNADDSVVLRVYVEPPASVHAVQTQYGTLNWTIEEWARRTAAQVGGLVEFQESPYFYPCGLRCQVRLSVGGLEMVGACGAGAEVRRVAVRMVFLSGMHDNDVMRMQNRTSVSLQNPGRQWSTCETLEVGANMARGYEVVFPGVQLHALLEDDTLLVVVDIQPVLPLASVGYLRQIPERN